MGAENICGIKQSHTSEKTLCFQISVEPFFVVVVFKMIQLSLSLCSTCQISMPSPQLMFGKVEKIRLFLRLRDVMTKISCCLERKGERGSGAGLAICKPEMHVH